MLLVKGNVGKSKVLEALTSTYENHCIGIVYEPSPHYVMFGTYIIDANELPISEFCKELSGIIEDFTDEGFARMLVIYTNLKEDEVLEIKNTVKRLEEEYYCGIGILMCKE